jgi:hypothetical protein
LEALNRKKRASAPSTWKRGKAFNLVWLLVSALERKPGGPKAAQTTPRTSTMGQNRTKPIMSPASAMTPARSLPKTIPDREPSLGWTVDGYTGGTTEPDLEEAYDTPSKAKPPATSKKHQPTNARLNA